FRDDIGDVAVERADLDAIARADALERAEERIAMRRERAVAVAAGVRGAGHVPDGAAERASVDAFPDDRRHAQTRNADSADETPRRLGRLRRRRLLRPDSGSVGPGLRHLSHSRRLDVGKRGWRGPIA